MTGNRLNSCGTPSCSSRDGFLSTDTDDVSLLLNPPSLYLYFWSFWMHAVRGMTAELSVSMTLSSTPSTCCSVYPGCPGHCGNFCANWLLLYQEEDSWWHQSSPSQSSICVDTPTALRLTAHLHEGGDDHKCVRGQNQRCATGSWCEQPSQSTNKGQLVLTQHSQRKHPIETTEAGTQTDSSHGPHRSDASIQCNLGQKHGTYSLIQSETDRLPVHPEIISASRGHPAQAEQHLQSVWNSDSHREHLRSGIGGHSSLSRGTKCFCRSEELPEPPSSRIHIISTAGKMLHVAHGGTLGSFWTLHFQ